jgi:hypothetical protein
MAAATPITLTTRALNRALLARQMLLAREAISPVRAVEQLIGLQAQQPRPPFIGLWTRLAAFDRDALLQAIRNRKVVRVTMMRATLHLVSAKDYLRFRSSMQPALTAARESVLRSRASAVDMDAIVAEAERCFANAPQTFAELRANLAQKFPDVDERAMGYLARTHLPLVMVPEDQEYGYGADTKFASASWYLKAPLDTEDRTQDLMVRYLAAFGPATVADAQTWSGLPKLKPVFETLRPKLITFRDERKRELFDVPNAPRPGEDTAAPVRFLPGFDNVILSHAERARIIADEHRPRVATKNLQILPTFLVDGFVCGTWDFSLVKKHARLTILPFKPLARGVKQDVSREAELLVRFLARDAGRFEILFRAE